MNEDKGKKYWFPAKRYGFGWRLPVAWQGWVTLILFISLVILDSIIFLPAIKSVEFSISLILLIILLFLIMLIKGEPLGWRFGKDSNT